MTMMNVRKPRMLIGLALASAIICAVHAVPAGQADDLPLHLFAYDRNLPLDVQERNRADMGDSTIIDLTYASPMGGRVPAYLIVPKGTGPFAGMLFMHGMPGDRKGRVEDCLRLASAGAVVLAIDAPFARPPAHFNLFFTEQDRVEQIQLIVDLQRGVDLLLSRPDVDPRRLAYVGFSFGGSMGGLFAGVERRLKAVALVVGAGQVDHSTRSPGPFDNLPRDQQARWLSAMLEIDPIRFVGHAAPAALLFQNGLDDALVAVEDATRYQQAGSEPKLVRWYPAGHFLNDQATSERILWLQEQIGIDAQRY
jgi:uncharacterized protein